MTSKESARVTKERHGQDHHARAGAKGGRARVPKGISLLRQTDPEAYQRAIEKIKATIKAKKELK